MLGAAAGFLFGHRQGWLLKGPSTSGQALMSAGWVRRAPMQGVISREIARYGCLRCGRLLAINPFPVWHRARPGLLGAMLGWPRQCRQQVHESNTVAVEAEGMSGCGFSEWMPRR